MAGSKNRRYSDRAIAASRHQISRLAFGLALLLIAVTSLSLVFIGFVASNASDEQALLNERRLFNSTITHHQDLFVRQMLNVARKDETVIRIVQNFYHDYAREVLGKLSTENKHDRSFLVSDLDLVVAESFGDYTHLTRQPTSDTPVLIDFINGARSIYDRNRTRVPGGFNYRSMADLPKEDLATVGFAMIDGRPAMIGAMPILPAKTTVLLPDGGPFVMVSARFLGAEFLSEINSQLNFQELRFDTMLRTGRGGPTHVVRDSGDTPIGSFVWVSETQNNTIWDTVIPIIVVLSLALAVLAFWIAWRIGKLTVSLQASEQQNRYLALHDTLSGLGNRLQFNRVLATSVAELPSKPFAVIHCDLDKFKAVNDTYGHAAGDAVIKAVAARMTSVIGRSGFVSRMGGDEFVILLRDRLDRKSLKELSHDLITTISEPIDLPNGVSADIGISVGIALAPEHGTEGEELMTAADNALYCSKEAGRGRMCFADEKHLVADAQNTQDDGDDNEDSAACA
ncbi:MAG: diguanylate cyclase [Rhodobacteraceae bacterium]|nr:diguanylate cyclase [Paracoccaceae bacterium]